MNGLAYFGKRNTLENASMMYAMMFDLDGVTGESLYAFFYSSSHYDEMPRPNLIIMSGTGVHLVYIFEEPIRLTPAMKDWLKWVKYNLLNVLWNDNTSLMKTRQYQGINQGFRPIGAYSKLRGKMVRAFMGNPEEWTLEGLEKYISPYDERETLKRMEKPQRPYEKSAVSLEEAKTRWPEWYATVQKEKETGIPREKKTWKNNPALYEWWYKKIQEKGAARCGHRYFCIFCLTIYAVKCRIPREKLREDAMAIQPYFNSLGAPLNPFKVSDVEAALTAYDKPEAAKYSIHLISALSGIPIEKKPHPDLERYNEQMKRAAERAGREYVPEKMTREKWLEIEARPRARIAQERYGTDWRNKKGRKTRENEIRAWIMENPYSRPVEASCALGISISVISRYWKQCGGLSCNERVDKWLLAHPEASSSEAMEALRISPNTFYSHKKKLDGDNNG